MLLSDLFSSTTKREGKGGLSGPAAKRAKIEKKKFSDKVKSASADKGEGGHRKDRFKSGRGDGKFKSGSRDDKFKPGQRDGKFKPGQKGGGKFKTGQRDGKFKAGGKKPGLKGASKVQRKNRGSSRK